MGSVFFFSHTLLSGLSSFPGLFLTRSSLVTIQYALSMASVSFKAEQPGIDTGLQMSFYMYSAWVKLNMLLYLKWDLALGFTEQVLVRNDFILGNTYSAAAYT